MGMAHHAPMDTYSRHYYVSHSAIQRFRECLPNNLAEEYRVDSDLGNALDHAVWDAVKCDCYEHIIDEEQPSMLVDLSENRFGELYALVRKDDHTNPQYQQAIITVLNKEQVDKKKADPKRGWKHAGSVGSKINSLKDKIAPIAIAQGVAVRKKAQEEEMPAAKAAPAPQVTTIGFNPNARKLIWPGVNEGDPDLEQTFNTKEEAAEKFASLVEEEGILPDDIEVQEPFISWRKVEKKVKIKVEL